MKKFYCLVIGLLLFGCGDGNYDYMTDSCTLHHDLCCDGTNKDWETCCDSDGSSCWYEVNGKTYYTAEYMIDQECD